MTKEVIDVLVVGSGGAGLTAALEACQHNANVVVLSKTHATHSQTCQAQGGINAAINNTKNSIQSHIDDTIKGAHGLYNKEAIRIMCEQAPKTIQWLNEIGVPFSRNENDEIAQRKFGAASEIRTCYSSDYTGLKILHTLYDQCIKKNIHFLNEYMLLSIIKKQNQAIGITALNIKTSEVIELFAKSIILATGGYGNLYHQYTTNSSSTTGEGIITALNAGCTLSNMEMVQFHPTAMKGNNILISESARGEGGYLVDENKERFIDELKPRDEVARAIYEKTFKGNKVYLDLTHIDKDKLLNIIPQEYRLARDFFNIELDKELLPINPAAHYCMGGIKTNVSCETNLKNLYAVGECAQVGLHGANRLGGNSLQEIITFGRIAGKSAYENSLNSTLQNESNSKEYLDDKKIIDAYFNKQHSENFYGIKKEMGKIFFNNVGLFKEENKLNEAKTFLESINIQEYGIMDNSKLYNKNLIEFIEFGNLLQLGSIVIKSALLRKESRGAHHRIEYTHENKNYEKNSIIQLVNGTINISFEDCL